MVYLVQWWLDRFGRLQFKSKVIVVFMPVVIFSLLLLGLLSTRIFSSSIIERTENSIRDQSSIIVSKLDSIISNAEICANLLVTDLDRLFESFPASRTPLEETRFRNLMQSRLGINLAMFPEVEAAVFVETDGTIHTSYDFNNNETLIFESGMLEYIWEVRSYGYSRWFPMQKRDFLTSDPNAPVITLGKVVTDIETGRMYGTLFLLVKESTLSDFLVGNGDSRQPGYYIVDDRMTIVASPNKDLLHRKISNPDQLDVLRQPGNAVSVIRNIEGDKELVTVMDFAKMKWKLVHVASIHLLTADIRQNNKLIILIGLLCLALSWFAANWLSRFVLNPLLQLAKAMRKVMEGNFSVSAPVHTKDEVGLIARAFNIMVTRLDELLRTIEREQIRKREYELALITAQIKPHFLYNTLDAIYVLNDMDRNEEARDTTKALADFYRMVLNKGRELIILDQELKIVGDYLSIMRVRYPDVFRYEIDIPPQLAGAPVPKLSLQPLVENAIYHGLKTKGKQGTISIGARAEEAKVIISVEDNGVGMTEEQARAIMAFPSGEDASRSIGLFSVQERLKLYFGESFGIAIHSRPGIGTIVEITVPGVHTGGKDHV